MFMPQLSFCWGTFDLWEPKLQYVCMIKSQKCLHKTYWSPIKTLDVCSFRGVERVLSTIHCSSTPFLKSPVIKISGVWRFVPWEVRTRLALAQLWYLNLIIMSILTKKGYIAAATYWLHIQIIKKKGKRRKRADAEDEEENDFFQSKILKG